MQRSDKAVGYWLLTLVWPFVGFLLSLREGLTRYTIPIILFFSFLYGYSVYLFGGDILHYRDAYQYVVDYTWKDFFYLVTHSLDPEGDKLYTANVVIQKPDLFALTFQFLVSRVTDNPRWFWGLLSVFYSYLIILFAKEVFKSTPFARVHWYQVVFTAGLFLVIPFYVGVTGVRFWTALFLFMIFLIKYIQRGHIKYVIFSASAILVHYAFFFPVALCLVGALINFNKWVVRSVLVLSFLVFLLSSTSNLFEFLQQWVLVFEDTTVESSVGGYVDEDIYQMRRAAAASRNWYVVWSSDLLLYFFMAITTIDLFRLAKVPETPITKRIFSILLIFFALTLLSFNLGSIARFKNIFFLLALVRYMILFNYYPQSRYLKRVSYAFLPVLFMFTVVSFRTGFYSIDPMLLMANPLSVFLTESTMSLSEWLVGH